MTLTDLGLIADECGAGIADAHKAAWQRIRDKRVLAILEKYPNFADAHGIVAIEDAVGLVVAGLMLRASSELCVEIGITRGLRPVDAQRKVAMLMDAEGEA